MDRRAAMQSVLDAEVKRWSGMSINELDSRLSDLCNYQLEQNGTVYQFEVEILERKPEYIHVGVSVDDGRLRYSIIPLCQSFVKRTQQSEL
jgi:hypothetical protein